MIYMTDAQAARYNDNESIVVYQSQDKMLRLDVTMSHDTVWLTQQQMSELFQKDRTVITRHIKNIFNEGELEEKSNVQIMHFTNSDRPVKLYNLD
ncbi:MAG TPA: virulence protein [Bacteroidales bacterium]|nr:virulence protein [Bacteroidales bacterium]